MSKKKDEAKAGGKEAAEVPLEALTLDHGNSLYPLPPLAAKWSRVLKRKQEFQHLRSNELLEKAMADTLSGKITAEMIDKEIEAAQKAVAEEAEAATAKPKLKLKTDEDDAETKESPKKKSKAAEKVSS